MRTVAQIAMFKKVDSLFLDLSQIVCGRGENRRMCI